MKLLNKTSPSLHSEVLEYFEYIDGCLFWRKNPGPKPMKGRRFGSNHNQGYRSGSFKGVPYLEHRLIYFYHNGYFPKEIDHIDGDRSNNKIENLRSCTRRDNIGNTKPRCKSSSYRGVTYSKSTLKKPWMVRVDRKYYGYFETEREAALFANTKLKEHFGDFAYQNEVD